MFDITQTNKLAETSGVTDFQGVISAEKYLALQDEIAEARSNLELVVSDDTATNSDVLRASAEVMLLAKDSLTNLQLSATMPSHVQNMLERTVNELNNVEKHFDKVEGLVSKYDQAKPSHFKPSNYQSVALTKDTNTKRRILSSKQESPKHPGLARADYHSRAKGHHGHPLLGNHFGHHQQQGYHGSRVSRQEGTHRRMMSTDTNKCVENHYFFRKEEQCLRLAACATEYSLYDMFVFEFGDDVDFSTGRVDTDIKAYDEKQMRAKVSSKVFSFLVYLIVSHNNFTSYNGSKK